MQACGAQFVETQLARDFVSQTLHSTCESLLQVGIHKLRTLFLMPHQAKCPFESEEMTDMILAGLLIQGISLFQQTADQRPAAAHYHGILAMASNRLVSSDNEMLNCAPLDDQAMWSDERLLLLGASRSLWSKCITDRGCMEKLGST
jgi:hypothetical protein